MIDILHMFLDLIIEKRANYIVDFLKLSDNFFIENPDDFKIDWLLSSKGAVLLNLTFTDTLFYEFMVDYSDNKKEMDKWANRLNYALKRQNKLSKWHVKSVRVIEEDNQKRIKIAFCQW